MLKKSCFLFATAVVLTFTTCKDNREANRRYRRHMYQTLSLEERRKPENALLAMEAHPDLEVSLFASEPMVSNPTNMDVDAKGRVWVCEAYNYGLTENQQDEPGGKISILEDMDGDGRADKKTIFYQGEDVSLALGVAVLGNKVYVTQSPHLMVFTDEDGDDKPDKKEILFTGMGNPGDHSAHAMIFGPDGKFYFNYGNAGNRVLNPDQTPVRDVFGHEIRSDGHPYHGGMIFRCNPDGSEFEVLAHNFRNNYEVTVDSYGNIWQSDNDDDGNKSCRINFILEYGNYGYLDEMTGEHWSVPRTGQHPEIPQRHWHQNDPGSVPNLLVTGAGSPAGICFYEGDLLPEVFQNQMIHTDAGPNVVRAYPVKKEGAGYGATMENILWSEKDKWFRPVDVAVAPDGSIMVADWYDPIVGGSAVGDTVGLGRIYRVARPDMDYPVETPEISNPEEAVDALKSPNMAMRYLGWDYLAKAGEEAVDTLENLWNHDNPVFRARALWLLGRLPEGKTYLDRALKDDNEDIRITAIRLARQKGVFFPDIASEMVNDPSPQVRRTVTIELRHEKGNIKDQIWAQLAGQHDGNDRWYLEALGIAAYDGWESCFTTWQSNHNPDTGEKAARDIIWLSRARSSIPSKISVISGTSADSTEITRFFRSFDFLEYEGKNEALLTLLDKDHPEKNLITGLVIQHIDAGNVSMTPQLRAAIRSTLDRIKGTQDYVNIIDNYDLAGYRDELLSLAISEGPGDLGVNAMKVLIGNEDLQGLNLVRNKIMEGTDESEVALQLLAPISTETSLNLIREAILNASIPVPVRRTAIRAMGSTWWGEDFLIDLVTNDLIAEPLKPVAASVLFSVYRANIREEAARYLEQPNSAKGASLPPVRDLLAFSGVPEEGKVVFNTFCIDCHQVNNNGINFGPDLSEIGNKLSKEGLFQSIIYPNQGINNGYEGYLIRLKNGGVQTGILLSESEEEVVLRQIGGMNTTIKRAGIEEIEMMDNSLMTNMTASMSQKELIDLVEYLSGLK